MSEYPKMLYRDGDEIDINGVGVETRIVDTPAEEVTAAKQGWRAHVIAQPTDVSEIIADRPRRGRPPKAREPVSG